MKVYYLYGQPGSGKTTLAEKIAEHIWPALVIDGDTIRGITGNKNYGISGRIQNLETAHNIALLALDQRLSVVIAMVSPYNELRNDFQEECRGRGALVTFIELKYEKERFPRGKDAFWVDEIQSMREGLILDTGFLSMQNCLDEILRK